jgi:hypothetical protein
MGIGRFPARRHKVVLRYRRPGTGLIRETVDRLARRYLAQAVSGSDEEVAAELERSAGRARGRGGWASTAAFLERAAELTQDTGCRARQLVAAAEAKLVAGEPSVAQALLERAAPDLTDPATSARTRRLEGDILFAAGENGPRRR